MDKKEVIVLKNSIKIIERNIQGEIKPPDKNPLRYGILFGLTNKIINI